MIKSMKVKYSIQVTILTKIGKGFLLNHCVGIVINQNVQFGKKSYFYQGITLGNDN